MLVPPEASKGTSVELIVYNFKALVYSSPNDASYIHFQHQGLNIPPLLSSPKKSDMLFKS